MRNSPNFKSAVFLLVIIACLSTTTVRAEEKVNVVGDFLTSVRDGDFNKAYEVGVDKLKMKSSPEVLKEVFYANGAKPERIQNLKYRAFKVIEVSGKKSLVFRFDGNLSGVEGDHYMLEVYSNIGNTKIEGYVVRKRVASQRVTRQRVTRERLTMI